MRRVISTEPESRDIIRHDVRSACKIHTARRRKIKHTTERFNALVCVPPGKSHIFKRLRRFGRAEFRRRAVFSRGLLELLELLRARSRYCRDLRHT